MEKRDGLKWNWSAQQMVDMIPELKQYCLERYERGGDVMIECWETVEWVDFLIKCDMFWREPKVCLDELMAMYRERQAAARNY